MDYNTELPAKKRQQYIRSKSDNIEYLLTELMVHLKREGITKTQIRKIERDLDYIVKITIDAENFSKIVDQESRNLNKILDETDFYDVPEIKDADLEDVYATLKDLPEEYMQQQSDDFISKLDKYLGKVRFVIPTAVKKKIFIILLLVTLGLVILRIPSCAVNYLTLFAEYKYFWQKREIYLDAAYDETYNWRAEYQKQNAFILIQLIMPFFKYQVFRAEFMIRMAFKLARTNILYIIRQLGGCKNVPLEDLVDSNIPVKFFQYL